MENGKNHIHCQLLRITELKIPISWLLLSVERLV